MSRDDEEWPKRFSLIDRSAMTFQSFLAGRFGKRFYQETFLEGIAARRVEANARVAKTFSSTFAFATLLAFFDLIEGQFAVFGVNVRITQDLVPVLAVLTASSLLAMCLALIDDLLIQRYINTIGNYIGIHSFPTFLIDKMAVNLWSDALIPRHFGEKSGPGHKRALAVAGFFAFIFMIIALLYPLVFILKAVFDVFHDESARPAAQILVCVAFILALWVVVLAVLFQMKFKFYRADFDEATLDPTPEFVAEMEAQIAQGDEPAE